MNCCDSLCFPLDLAQVGYLDLAALQLGLIAQVLPSLGLVFKGLVQSSLLTILGMDLDLDQSRLFLKWSRPGLD